VSDDCSPGCGKRAETITGTRRSIFYKRRKPMIRKFLGDERGLELSEYAVAAALIALATVGAFQLLGTSITGKITTLANNVK
jgi:Flp pilus assembly pilin Flp